MEEKTLHIAGNEYPVDKVNDDITEALKVALEEIVTNRKTSVRIR